MISIPALDTFISDVANLKDQLETFRHFQFTMCFSSKQLERLALLTEFCHIVNVSVFIVNVQLARPVDETGNEYDKNDYERGILGVDHTLEIENAMGTT